MRTKIAVDKRRPDGRSENEIRPITATVGLTPRTHGSALFTRGQTQALTLLTLGTVKEEQRIDDLSLDTTKRYIHHYNFPPFSVGETGFMRGPKRRDIGHGALAERALVPVCPKSEQFAYTIRAVSEILESNGSSSMASVCGSSLALMDAGVPITAPVAGIAMGLIKEGDDHVILTDIQGAEDHLGDMDFKVAGTPDGITALQMDIKITGVTREILRDALAQAQDARLSILQVMDETISEPRTELAEHAPQVLQTQISPDQIGLLIGKGGETIRGMQDEFDVQIDVEEDGSVRIYGVGDPATSAREHIDQMMRPVQVGDVLRERKVVKTSDFGAFVELRKGTDGLLHVSRVSPGVRIDTVEQVLSAAPRRRRGGRGRLRPRPDRAQAGRPARGRRTSSPRRTIGERYKLAYPEGERSERPPREDGDRGDRRAAWSRRPRPGPAAPSTCASITSRRCRTASGSPPRRCPGSVRRRLGVYVGVGSRDEAPPVGGVSHFIEHLLFRGSDVHSRARDRADLRPLRRRAERGHLPRDSPRSTRASSTRTSMPR